MGRLIAGPPDSWIGDICAVNEGPALSVANAFHIDSSVRTSHDTGNKRKQRLESLV